MWGILQETLRSNSLGQAECYNQYDTRHWDTWPECGTNWPENVAFNTAWLRRPSTQAALHVPEAAEKNWDECRPAVQSALHLNDSRPSAMLLPSILEHVNVVLYSGGADLIVNHIGTEMMIADLEWNGAVGWGSEHGSLMRTWREEGGEGIAGRVRRARNLTFVIIDEASHMVPYDQPRRSREMAYRAMGVLEQDLWDDRESLWKTRAGKSKTFSSDWIRPVLAYIVAAGAVVGTLAVVVRFEKALKN